MIFDKQSDYKKSENYWIPACWITLPLGAVASSRKTKDVAFCGLPCIELEHIESGSGRLLKWDSSGNQLSVKTAFVKGDVLFGKLRPYLRKYTIAPFDGVCTTEILAVHPLDISKVDKIYLFYLMQGEGVQSTVAKLSYGTKMPRVSWTDLSEIKLAFPTYIEQQKIAAILAKVDDKLNVISRQISATRILKKSLMKSLFGKGVGLQDNAGDWIPHSEFKNCDIGEIPDCWNLRTLESVANVERGKFSARPRNDPQYFEHGDIPFIQTGDITASARFIDKASQFLNAEGLAVSKLFPVGTIFITIAANIGDLAIGKIPMACPDSVVGINATDECDSVWLYYLLSNSKSYFDSRATQNAQKNINLQVLRPFSFGLPPLPEQQYIASILTTIDDKIEILSSKKDHYQTLKRGLMQKLLTGEWRVKIDDPTPEQ